MCPIRTDARSCAASLKRLPHILPTPQGLCPMNCAYQTQNHCEARTVGGCWRAVQLGLQLGCTVFVPCAGAMELNLHRTVQGAQPPNARKQVLWLCGGGRPHLWARCIGLGALTWNRNTRGRWKSSSGRSLTFINLHQILNSVTSWLISCTMV